MAKLTAKQMREERLAKISQDKALASKKSGAMQGLLNDTSRGANGVERKLYYLSINDLVPSKYNHYHKTEKEILDLAANIDATELQQPLLVRMQKDGKYTILSGHTRFEAVKRLIEQGKWKGNQIPCTPSDVVEKVKEKMKISDKEAEEIVVVSANVQRIKSDADILNEVKVLESLTNYYRERGVKVISKEDADDVFFSEGDEIAKVRTRDIIAEKTELSPAQIAKVQNVNKNAAASVKKAIEDGKISIGVAHDIAKLPVDKQEEFVKSTKGKKIEKKTLDGFKQEIEEKKQFTIEEFKADFHDIETILSKSSIGLSTTERKQYESAVKVIRKLICK